MPQSQQFQKLTSNAKSHVKEVSPVEAKAKQEAGALVVDVREAEEFANGHVPGAVHLSRGTVEMRIEEHASETSAPIVCYCGGGGRSALATESLQRMGYTNVASLAGGFRAWKEAGLPTE